MHVGIVSTLLGCVLLDNIGVVLILIYCFVL